MSEEQSYPGGGLESVPQNQRTAQPVPTVAKIAAEASDKIEADTKRLDWLEENGADAVYDNLNDDLPWSVYIAETGDIDESGKTLREAIDKAKGGA